MPSGLFRLVELIRVLTKVGVWIVEVRLLSMGIMAKIYVVHGTGLHLNALL